jgi:hypothetical protein
LRDQMVGGAGKKAIVDKLAALGGSAAPA